MISALEGLLDALRPAFSRKSAFYWFVMVFIGLILRNDYLGVTSIVRSLDLTNPCYLSILHFFHSSAWSVRSLFSLWQNYVFKSKYLFMSNERIILIGDHTKTPKDARKMPELRNIHDNSETSTKPSYFRGHEWGFISVLIGFKEKFFSVPIFSEIHQNYFEQNRIQRLIMQAAHIAESHGKKAYLILDAFFAVGTSFLINAVTEGTIHILTRAKKNIVAHELLTALDITSGKKGRGRPRKYGKSINLLSLFNSKDVTFITIIATIYGIVEEITYFEKILYWKPAGRNIKFILINSSHGKIILMSSDLEIDAKLAIELYCRRIKIEGMFNVLKNILYGFFCHFWTKGLPAQSRRPEKNKNKQEESTIISKQAKNTLAAIEKYVAINVILLGFLQMLACSHAEDIFKHSKLWLRTNRNVIPSEFITLVALANVLRNRMICGSKSWVIKLIKEKRLEYNRDSTKKFVA